MDRHAKQEIKRLWRDRLLLGAFVLVAISLSAEFLKSFLYHRPQRHAWVAEYVKKLDKFSDDDISYKNKQALSGDLSLTARTRELKLSTSITLLHQELDLEQVLYQGLALDLEQVLYQELVLEWEQEQEQELRQELKQVLLQVLALEVEQLDLEQALKQEQEQVLELELMLELKQVLMLEQLLELEWALNQEQKQALELKLEQKRSLLKSIVIQSLEDTYGVSLAQGEDLDTLKTYETDHVRYFLSALGLGLSLILLSIVLFSLSRLRGRMNLPASAHMLAFLPEECVAEMGVVCHRMKKAKASPWAIRWRMTEEFLTLLWVFYVRVQIDNIGLPPGDRSVDD